jgi:hypothetical protein
MSHGNVIEKARLLDRHENRKKFMDQKILKGLSRVFSCGGTIHIESDDGYKGTITLPGPAEEEE